MIFNNERYETVAFWDKYKHVKVYITAENKGNFTLLTEKKVESPPGVASRWDPEAADILGLLMWLHRLRRRRPNEHHTDPRTDEMVRRKERKTEVVFISPLRCVRPFKKKKRKETSLKQKRRVQRGWEPTTSKENRKKREQLQSLIKAAVAIFPLPTKYSQMFVKLRIYCCFTAYDQPNPPRFVFSL